VFLLLFRFVFPRLVRPNWLLRLFLYLLFQVSFFWLSLCYYNPANKDKSVHVKYGFMLKAFAISPLDLLLSFIFFEFSNVFI
jgi:hypothetical protein